MDTFHRFSYFLGTGEGEFYKRSIELVIYTMLSYMIISEYKKSKRLELKYFMIAFVSLMVHRFILVVVNASVLFSNTTLSSLDFFLPVLLSSLDLITIVLLVNAFLFPMIEEKKWPLQTITQMIMVILFALLMQLVWVLQKLTGNTLDYTNSIANLGFIAVDFFILILAFSILWKKEVEPLKYRRKIMLGFAMYLMTPLLQIINFIFFGNQELRLQLLEQPFPFLAIILFTEVIYLKLVDKAYLQEQLEATQKRYREQKELSKMKDEFVSTVSHELRTPITSIKLYLSLLQQHKFGKITPKQEKALETIKQENDRLAFLIDDLLNLSRLESGKEKLKITQYDLNELKSPLYSQLAKERKLKLVYHIPKYFIVTVDREKIKQVFLNLLNNAIKFTHSGGLIEVIAEKREKEWSLSIKDTGVGIPEENIPYLFNKFYQVEHHMTRTQRGTGLGLAIAKKIIDLHKGTITVTSEPGKGSTFTVTIPYEIKME